MWRAYRRPSLAARLRPGPAGISPPGVRLGSESLFGFGRNGCSASLGIGVRLQSECPLGFRRNLQQRCLLADPLAKRPGGDPAVPVVVSGTDGRPTPGRIAV